MVLGRIVSSATHTNKSRALPNTKGETPQNISPSDRSQKWAVAIFYQFYHTISNKVWELVILKKLIFLLFASLVLVACGSDDDREVQLTAHINIRDEIIGDSYQVMRIIEKAVDKDEKPEMDILFDYTDKYLHDYENQNLTDEEYELVMITSLMIIKVNDYITISSERRDFESDKEAWYKTLETGEYQKIN